MSYQIVPNIIFIVSVLGVVLIILRRLPEAHTQTDPSLQDSAVEKLTQKGLPAIAISKSRVMAASFFKKIWNFALEAKDLKPHATVGYRIKKIFGGKLPGSASVVTKPQNQLEQKDENFFLDKIKLEPKNLKHYDELGKFYLDQNKFQDARDIYQYLTNHQPTNPDFFARLGFCLYKTEDFEKASEAYKKSIALDSTQPNRYYNLGLSQEASGKLEEAVQSFEHANTLEATVKYYEALANAYEALGNEHKQREAQFRAKKLKDQQIEAKKS